MVHGGAAARLAESREIIEELEARAGTDALTPAHRRTLRRVQFELRALVLDGRAEDLEVVNSALDVLRRALVLDLAASQRRAAGNGRVDAEPPVHPVRRVDGGPRPVERGEAVSLLADSRRERRITGVDVPASPTDELVGAIQAAGSMLDELQRASHGSGLTPTEQVTLRDVTALVQRALRRHEDDASLAELVESAAEVVKRSLVAQLGRAPGAGPEERAAADSPGGGILPFGGHAPTGVVEPPRSPAPEARPLRPVPLAPSSPRRSAVPPPTRPAPGALGLSRSSEMTVALPVVSAPPHAPHRSTEDETPEAAGALLDESAISATRLSAFGGARLVGAVLVLFVIYVLYGTAFIQGNAQRTLSAASHARLRAVDIGLDELILGSATRSALTKGPGLASGSAAPGSTAPVVVLGHRVANGAPFRHIGALRSGSQIVLTAKATTYTYVVERQLIASRHDAIVESAGSQTLLLVSAAPAYRDARRLVVVARLVSPVASAVPAETITLPGVGGSSLDLLWGMVVLGGMGWGWAWRRARRATLPRWVVWASWVPTVSLAYVSWQLMLGSMSRLL